MSLCIADDTVSFAIIAVRPQQTGIAFVPDGLGKELFGSAIGGASSEWTISSKVAIAALPLIVSVA